MEEIKYPEEVREIHIARQLRAYENATERLTLTIPKNVLKKLREQARRERRSISNMTAVILEKEFFA